MSERGNLTKLEIAQRCAHIRANPALALFIASNKFIQTLRHPAEVKAAKEFAKKLQTEWELEV